MGNGINGWRHLLSTPLPGMTFLRSALFLPFLGERLGGERCALVVAEMLVSAEMAGTEPLLQMETDLFTAAVKRDDDQRVPNQKRTTGVSGRPFQDASCMGTSV